MGNPPSTKKNKGSGSGRGSGFVLDLSGGLAPLGGASSGTSFVVQAASVRPKLLGGSADVQNGGVISSGGSRLTLSQLTKAGQQKHKPAGQALSPTRRVGMGDVKDVERRESRTFRPAPGMGDVKAVERRESRVVPKPSRTFRSPGMGDVKEVERQSNRALQRERLRRAGLPVMEYDHPMQPGDEALRPALDNFGEFMLGTSDLPVTMLNRARGINEPSGFLRGERTAINPSGMPGGRGYAGPTSNPARTLGRRFSNAVIPTLAGTVTGAAAGTAVPVVGNIAGGIVGGFAAGLAQDATIKGVLSPEDYALYQQATQRDQEAHPFAALAGELAPGLLTAGVSASNVWKAGQFGASLFRQGGRAALRNGLVQKLGEEAGEEAFQVAAGNAANVGLGTAIGLGQEGFSQFREGKFDPWRLVLAGSSGALLNKSNAFGDFLHGVGARPVRQIQARMGMSPLDITPVAVALRDDLAQRPFFTRRGWYEHAREVGEQANIPLFLTGPSIRRTPGGEGGKLSKSPTSSQTFVAPIKLGESRINASLRRVKDRNSAVIASFAGESAQRRVVEQKQAMKRPDGTYDPQQVESWLDTGYTAKVKDKNGQLIDKKVGPTYEKKKYAIGLEGRNNVYFVMPSTSGKNIIPELLAKRLQGDFGGEIVTDFAIPLNGTEAKKRMGSAKLTDPSSYKIIDSVSHHAGKNLVIVDDTFTSGESVMALADALRGHGLDDFKVAVLGIPNPSTATTFSINGLMSQLATALQVPRTVVEQDRPVIEHVLGHYGDKMVTQLAFPLRTLKTPQEKQQYAKDLLDAIRSHPSASAKSNSAGAGRLQP